MTKKTTIAPPFDPPIGQLHRVGTGGMSDGDLLALVLGSRVPLQTAHAIAEEYPLERLVNLPWDEIKRVPGLSEDNAAILAAATELARRGLDRGVGELPKLVRPSDVVSVVTDVRTEKREHFIALYLNARRQLVQKTVISIGTLDGSLVHPREVFTPALECSASAMIIVHNHPSGDPTPSKQDITLTRRLMDAGLVMGIEVLDHIVIARDSWVSMKQISEM
jgi:DNA repair protein RadC